ncbi:MAG TPA: hypothetical protein VMT82_08915 [candidate division Zixibacteria bacterium]|nr:hypothetical protein [candidate division Zixibacteria bacterium]
MAGTLHVFRRRVVNGGEHFQVNYTVAGKSFAKVVGDADELIEFLEVDVALAPELTESLWQELDRRGSGFVEGVEMNQLEATAKGMLESPSEF